MARTTRTVARTEGATPDDLEKIVLRDEPHILSGAVRGWGAVERWSPQYLRRKIADVPVSFKASPSHVHPHYFDIAAERRPSTLLEVLRTLLRRYRAREPVAPQSTSFAGYLDRVTSDDRPDRYYLSGDEVQLFDEGRWNERLDTLREDFDLPSCLAGRNLKTIGLWFSARGVRSQLHYDGNGCHNLNAQVTGRKLVSLYAPRDLPRLYPYYFSKIHPGNFSEVNIEKADPGRFPLFAEAQCFEGELRSGDLLFIPAFWFHSFKHLEDFNSNVNFWWRPESVPMSPVAVRQLLLATAGESRRRFKISAVILLWLCGYLEHALLAPLAPLERRDR